MIEPGFLSAWDKLVESAAILAVILLAFGVMMRVVKLANPPRRIGLIAGSVILLTMLPAITLSLWNSMSFAQHLGVALIVIGMFALFRATHGRPKAR